MSPRAVALALGAAVAAAAAAPADAQPIRFTDVSREAGLTRSHVDSGYLMGSGGAFFDKDEDGDLDVLLTGSLGSPWLYENLGGGAFADVTGASGLKPGGASDIEMAVACADVENDGDTDVFLGAWGRSRLFMNVHGDGSTRMLEDRTLASGIDVHSFTTGAAFGDYDLDGFLDLYVGNYIGQIQFPNHVPARNALLRNRGDGSFEDVTRKTGVAGKGTTLAVTWTDVDEDGDLDLWVGNDFGAFVQPNELFVNEGSIGVPGYWNFTERAAAAGTDQSIFCMGITVGDIDHDQDLDAFVTNLGRNVLLRNDGAAFVDITTAAGVEGARDPTQPDLYATSWGCGFFDFDRDTWVDLYVSNGYIPAAAFIQNGTKTPNFLYRNRGLGDGSFQDLSAVAGVDSPLKGRGAAFGDYDGDGDVDILQTNVAGSLAGVLYRNDSVNSHHALRVLPIGRRVSRTAIGTRVTARLHGATLVREANPNMSFESSSDPAVHLGTGTETSIPHLRLAWLSGVRQDLHDVEARGTLTLLEPLLTLDDVPVGPATGKVGRSWTAEVGLSNHDARGHRATLSVRFLCGAFEQSSPAWTATVDGETTQRETVTLTLPDPGPGAPAALRVVLAVEDAAGGRDECVAEITLVP